MNNRPSYSLCSAREWAPKTKIKFKRSCAYEFHTQASKYFGAQIHSESVDGRCKMRSSFSVPRAPGQNPAVPNHRHASVASQHHSMHHKKIILELVKSLKKGNSFQLLQLEEQNLTILKELGKLQETTFSVKGSSFEVCVQSHEAQDGIKTIYT